MRFFPYRRRTRMNYNGFCMELCMFHCFCFLILIFLIILYLYNDIYTFYLITQNAYDKLHNLISMGSRKSQKLSWRPWAGQHGWRAAFCEKLRRKKHGAVGKIRSFARWNWLLYGTIYGIYMELLYIYMELELNYYICIYVWNISPYSSIYMELELYCLEIYWWSKPLSVDSWKYRWKTAWYFLKGFSSSIVRVPTVTAQLYTAKVELRSLRCKT